MTKALSKLEAKRAALDAKIKAERERQAALERKQERDKHEAIGAAVAAHALTDAGFNATLQKLLAERVTHPRMRTLLNLPALPDKKSPERRTAQGNEPAI